MLDVTPDHTEAVHSNVYGRNDPHDDTDHKDNLAVTSLELSKGKIIIQGRAE